jgi:hypothetical protein
MRLLWLLNGSRASSNRFSAASGTVRYRTVAPATGQFQASFRPRPTQRSCASSPCPALRSPRYDSRDGLSDPQLEQQLLSAQSALKGAQADYKSLNATLQSTLMDKKIAAAQVNSSYATDLRQAQTDEQLYKLGVVSGVVAGASKNTAEQLTAQKRLSEEQLDVNAKAIEVQLSSAQTKVEQAKAQLDLYQKQSEALHVRAGISGVLAAAPCSLAGGPARDRGNVGGQGDSAGQAEGRSADRRDPGARHPDWPTCLRLTPTTALFRVMFPELIHPY